MSLARDWHSSLHPHTKHPHYITVTKPLLTKKQKATTPPEQL